MCLKRHSIILGEDNYYHSSILSLAINKDKYPDYGKSFYICIAPYDNIYLAKPYLKVYINRKNKDYRSCISKMCRISLFEPDYLAIDDEDLIFTNKEKIKFIEIMSDNWKNILIDYIEYIARDIFLKTCAKEAEDELRDKYFTLKDIENMQMPDYSKLITIEDVNIHQNTKANYINNYDIWKCTKMKEFYQSLSKYSSDIVYEDLNICMVVYDYNKLKVYDKRKYNNINNDTPYMLCNYYGQFIPNEYYKLIDSNEVDENKQFKDHIYFSIVDRSTINIPRPFEINCDTGEVAAMLYSARNNINFDDIEFP